MVPQQDAGDAASHHSGGRRKDAWLPDGASELAFDPSGAGGSHWSVGEISDQAFSNLNLLYGGRRRRVGRGNAAHLVSSRLAAAEGSFEPAAPMCCPAIGGHTGRPECARRG